MPQLDHTGPESKGPKTGRKLGKCHKTDSELSEAGALGIGEGKRFHSDGGQGKGRRKKYYLKKDSSGAGQPVPDE